MTHSDVILKENQKKKKEKTSDGIILDAMWICNLTFSLFFPPLRKIRQ